MELTDKIPNGIENTNPFLFMKYFYKWTKIFGVNGRRFFLLQVRKNMLVVHDETNDIGCIHNTHPFGDKVHTYMNKLKNSFESYTRAYFSSFFSKDLSGITVSLIFILFS